MDYNFIFWMFILPGIIFPNIYLFQSFQSWKNDYKLSRLKKFWIHLVKNPDVELIAMKDWVIKPVKKPNKAIIIVRHDVDISLKRAMKMIELEAELQIPAIYFLRNNAEKFTFSEVIEVFKSQSSIYFDVGFHYETLAKTKGKIDPAIPLFKEEVEEFKKHFPITLVAGHGEKYVSQKLVRDNYLDLTEYNLKSAYRIGHDLYISEAGGKHHFIVDKKSVTFWDKLAILDDLPKGSVVQILIHADWWF